MIWFYGCNSEITNRISWFDGMVVILQLGVEYKRWIKKYNKTVYNNQNISKLRISSLSSFDYLLYHEFNTLICTTRILLKD